MTAPYRVRAASAGDFGFVLDTWRRSFEGAPAVMNADKEHFIGEMNTLITRMLNRAGTIVRIACDADDEDTIIGFAALTGSELHYTYVRRDFRGHGIVPAMLAAHPVRSYTFRTQAGERRLKPRERGWVYTPRFTL